MRTMTTTHTAVFDAAKRGALPTVYTKVEIDRTGSGSWVDLTDFNGINYVTAVTISESRNTDISTATVSLLTTYGDQPATSLSPFATTSIPNTGGVLLLGDRKIRIYTATLPNGWPSRPASGSSYWQLMFRGRITRPKVSIQGITLTARDEGGELQDKWIETVGTYGSASPGTAVETVMQSLLTDWARTTTTLYSENGTSGTPFAGGDSPSWNILAYNQQRMPLMQALKVLADQIGYSLRYRFHEGSGIDDFVLVLEEPDRTISTSQWTINKEFLISCSIQNDETRVRNVVLVTYTDRDEGNTRATVTSTDATSIANYGRRVLIIGLASTSQIDSSTEATTLADALKDDLKDRAEVIQARIPYASHLQLNDYLTLETEGVLFGADKDASVESIRHTLGTDGYWTDLTLSGQPTHGETRNAVKGESDKLGQLSSNNLSSAFVRTGAGLLTANGDFSDWGNG